MNGLVTVCITTYNRKELLPMALNSILEQTYENFELLIIDDCSTDGTKEFIVEELLPLDTRIKYFSHEINKGLATARNTAIFNANGKYFTFCDDDDEWDKTFLEEFVNESKKYDNTWCFCCGTRYKKNAKSLSVIYDMKGKLIDYIKNGYLPPVAAQFYHTEELKKIGGYNINIKSGVDHDLWLKLAFSGYHIKSLPKALAYPNTNMVLNRMTHTTNKREIGIQNALDIWKRDIIDNLGETFFIQFCNDYYDNLKIVEMKKSIKSRDIMRVIDLFKMIHNKFKFMKFIFRTLNRKLYLSEHRVIMDKGLFSD